MPTCQRCGEEYEASKVKIVIKGKVIGGAHSLNCPRCENEYTEADSKTEPYPFSVDRVAAVYEVWRELTEKRVGHKLPNIETFDLSNDSTVLEAHALPNNETSNTYSSGGFLGWVAGMLNTTWT